MCFVRMNCLVYYYLVKFIGRFPYQYEVCQESPSLYLIKGKTLTTIDISVMEDTLHMALFYNLYLHMSVLHSNIKLFFSFCFQLLKKLVNHQRNVQQITANIIFFHSSCSSFNVYRLVYFLICRRIQKVSVHLCNTC